MINNLQTPETDIQTFRRLRKAIGLMGMSLPFVLVLLSLIPFFKTNVQQSISYYYYTNLREIFVGVLCAVSLFLIRYRGFYNPVFWKNDNKMTNLAGIMALGVALVPTNPAECCEKIYTLIPVCAKFIGWFHYFFAASFFLILAIISIVIFTIGQNHDPGLKPGLFNENNIYRICGYVIILCVILIPICDVLNLFRSSTLILEALALIAFGISWLIKGRVFGDKGKVGVVLYRESNK
jgi:hypothetical protein